MKSLEEHVEWYLTTVRVGLVKQMQYLGLSASGNTTDNIRTLIEGGKGLLIVPPHFHTLVDGIGRRPGGKLPPIEEITKWIAQRGLDLSPWAVAKSIQRKGNLIYQKRKRGVDLKGEIEAHREEFLKRVSNQLKINLVNKYKSL